MSEELSSLSALLSEGGREDNKGYFFRLASYDPGIESIIERYYGLCRDCGRIFEARLANPSAEETAAAVNAMKGAFSADKKYIENLLAAIPGLGQPLCGRLAEEISLSLCDSEKKGMNDNIRRNVFVKYYCWLKNNFRECLAAANAGRIPRLLYMCDPGKHEIWLLSVLSKCGFDVLVILVSGESGSLAAGSEARYSQNVSGGISFPKGFSLNKYKSAYDAAERLIKNLSGNSRTAIIPNVWLTGELTEDILMSPEKRGSNGEKIFTLYGRINGAKDKNSYLSALYNMYMSLRDRRRTVVIDEGIKPPSNEEISAVRRGSYNDVYSLIGDLAKNLVHSSPELQCLMRRAFGEVMLEYFHVRQDIRRALAKAVYLICWTKRYQYELFSGWKPPVTAALIFMGGCKDGKESLFLKMISRLPADVLILAPDLERKCSLEDSRLYERNYVNSLPVTKFPKEDSGLQMGTVAFYAERELDNALYGSTDTALYRSQQFDRANALRLRSTYEEIALTWNEDVKFRPNFTARGDVVTIPVFSAKISGVKNSDVKGYWDSISGLITEDTAVIANAPVITEKIAPGCRPVKDGKLRLREIKADVNYRYGFLSEQRQDHILGKIQLLIDKNIIKNGSADPNEIAVIGLSLGSELLRLIQRFDFTGKNPKLIYINTTENVISYEDSVAAALLSLIGFDVLYFLPTGYSCAEKYLSQELFDEHRIGEFMFDLAVPELKNPGKRKKSFFDRLFSRDT